MPPVGTSSPSGQAVVGSESSMNASIPALASIPSGMTSVEESQSFRIGVTSPVPGVPNIISPIVGSRS
jgi:hypothetical protein